MVVEVVVVVGSSNRIDYQGTSKLDLLAKLYQKSTQFRSVLFKSIFSRALVRLWLLFLSLSLSLSLLFLIFSFISTKHDSKKFSAASMATEEKQRTVAKLTVVS